MRPFEYFEPTSTGEVVALLQEHEQARLVAGGTDLLIRMKAGQTQPSALIALRRVGGMRGIAARDDGGVAIGAATTFGEIIGSDALGGAYDILRQAARTVGSTQIRNAATVGGNLCNAAPSADSSAPMLALDATAVLFGPGGQRTVPLTEFFVGPFQTALGHGEFLVELRLPAPAPHSAGCYLKHSPREAMDLAMLGVAAVVAAEPGTGRCRRARIALATMAPTPMRATEAEARLEGQVLTLATIRKAAAAAVAEARPRTSWRSSAEYRKTVAMVLIERAITIAAAIRAEVADAQAD